METTLKMRRARLFASMHPSERFTPNDLRLVTPPWASLAHHMDPPNSIGRLERNHAIQSSRAPSLGRGLGIRYRRGEILSPGLKLAVFWKIFLPIQHLENLYSGRFISHVWLYVFYLIVLPRDGPGQRPQRRLSGSKHCHQVHGYSAAEGVSRKRARKQRNCTIRILRRMQYTLWE